MCVCFAAEKQLSKSLFFWISMTRIHKHMLLMLTHRHPCPRQSRPVMTFPAVTKNHTAKSVCKQNLTPPKPKRTQTHSHKHICPVWTFTVAHERWESAVFLVFGTQCYACHINLSNHKPFTNGYMLLAKQRENKSLKALLIKHLLRSRFWCLP